MSFENFLLFLAVLLGGGFLLYIIAGVALFLKVFLPEYRKAKREFAKVREHQDDFLAEFNKDQAASEKAFQEKKAKHDRRFEEMEKKFDEQWSGRR